MIDILIVDDHDLVREGLRALLESEPGFRVVGEAGDGKRAIDLTKELQPHVVLMDLSLPGGLGGLEATEAIVADCPGVKVVILTQHSNREYVKRAMRIGAHGFLPKQSLSGQVKDAIVAVHSGERYLHPSAASELVDMLTSGEDLSDEALDLLTPREKQVLKLLAEGRTSREISKYLNISLKTAMTHRSNLMQKLDMHSRTDLIKFAIRNRIVEL